MHAIGDCLVYGASGVMTVVDIREEMIGDDTRKYYVLKPEGVRSESLTFVPVDNERLVALMRPLLTREEIMAAIREAISAPDCSWPADNRRRSDVFKEIIESGDRAAMLTMIRTIHRAGLRREEEGKKNAKMFELMFGMPLRETSKSVFAGDAFEFMTKKGPGKHGHIGIRTHFVDRAMAYFKRMGFEFDESSITYDEKSGKPKFVYFKDEIAGFAVHLVQK